jgi:hypothetical protein
MKFTFQQAKIDVNRHRNDTKPLCLNALLIEILLQHQRVDPTTFHFLPTDDGSTAAGAITKSSDIPNAEAHIKCWEQLPHA